MWGDDGDSNLNLYCLFVLALGKGTWHVCNLVTGSAELASVFPYCPGPNLFILSNSYGPLFLFFLLIKDRQSRAGPTTANCRLLLLYL